MGQSNHFNQKGGNQTYPPTATTSEWIQRSLHFSTDNDLNLYQDDWLCRINPYVRFAQYGELPPNYVIRPRILYDYEIVYIKSGTADIVINGIHYSATQGDLFFFKPSIEHAVYVHDEPLVQPYIHFDLRYECNSGSIGINHAPRAALTEEQLKLIRPNELDHFFDHFPDHLHFANPLHLEQLICDVIDSYTTPEPFNELRLKYQFLHMLDRLLNEINWQRSKYTRLPAEQARSIRLYLERNLDRRVTLQELSEVYHFDKSYISRIFRKMYGLSPIHTHLLMRLNRAKRMIIYTNLSLSDIAERNGFSSLQDFSRAFRRHEGIAPSSLRESMQSSDKLFHDKLLSSEL